MKKVIAVIGLLFLTGCATSDSFSVVTTCPHQQCDLTAVHHHVY